MKNAINYNFYLKLKRKRDLIMFKKLGVLFVILAMTIAATACNADKNSAQNEEVTTNSSTTTEAPKKKDIKVDVTRLSETSKPVGVSELSARVEGASAYVKCKITNNNDEYDESLISLSVEVSDATAKVISTGVIVCDRALRQGESYVLDDYLGYANIGKNATESAQYTAKVLDIDIQDGEEAKKEKEMQTMLEEIDHRLTRGEYNTAQLLWEEFKETYSTESKIIKSLEAALKDEGYDPNNLAAGKASSSNSSLDNTEDNMSSVED